MSKEDSGGSVSENDEAVLLLIQIILHSIKIYQKMILVICYKNTE